MNGGGKRGWGTREERILPFFSFVLPRVSLDECARQGPARVGHVVRTTVAISTAPWSRLMRA